MNSSYLKILVFHTHWGNRPKNQQIALTFLMPWRLDRDGCAWGLRATTMTLQVLSLLKLQLVFMELFQGAPLDDSDGHLGLST